MHDNERRNKLLYTLGHHVYDKVTTACEENKYDCMLELLKLNNINYDNFFFKNVDLCILFITEELNEKDYYTKYERLIYLYSIDWHHKKRERKSSSNEGEGDEIEEFLNYISKKTRKWRKLRFFKLCCSSSR